MDWFDACVDPELRPALFGPLPVWIGVDASVKRDSTAIVAVTWDEESKRVGLVSHRIFQPTSESSLDFEATIEETLTEMARRFDLREIKFDPFQMQAVAQRLQKRGLPIVEFPQTVLNLTEASTNLYELATPS
jgi:phage terminase large subunit-like protein